MRQEPQCSSRGGMVRRDNHLSLMKGLQDAAPEDLSTQGVSFPFL